MQPSSAELYLGETTGSIEISGDTKALPEGKSTGSALPFIKYMQLKRYVFGNHPCSELSPGSIQDGCRLSRASLAQEGFGHWFHAFFV